MGIDTMSAIERCGENTMRLWLLCYLALLLGVGANPQERRPNARLSQSEFVSLAQRCAPGVPADTLLAIARTESDLNPNAISINRPRATARRAGHRDGELFLAKQPRDQQQALSWLRWFSLHRYTVSIGLMQVNADMAPQLQVRPEQLLEPCTNVRVGATILTAVYTQLAREMGDGFSALDVALSFYNTGDSSAGLRNGYVASVYAHAPRRLP